MYRVTLKKLYELLEETGCCEEVQELKKDYQLEAAEIIEVDLQHVDPDDYGSQYCITEINIWFPETVLFAEPDTVNGGWTFHWAPRNPREEFKILV